jgi:hypothetical protein
MSKSIPRLALAACLMVPGCLASVPSPAASAPVAVVDAGSSSGAEQKEAQRKLTDKDILAFLQASKSIEPIVARQPEDKRDDPDAATLAQLERAAKAAGLKDYEDYDEIAANVGFVLQGFDPEKKSFVGHKARLEAEIARVKADKSLSEQDKAEAVKELGEELENVDEVQYAENIALVAKHYDELSAALEADEGQ